MGKMLMKTQDFISDALQIFAVWVGILLLFWGGFIALLILSI